MQPVRSNSWDTKYCIQQLSDMGCQNMRSAVWNSSIPPDWNRLLIKYKLVQSHRTTPVNEQIVSPVDLAYMY